MLQLPPAAKDYLVLSHGWVQGDLAEIAAQAFGVVFLEVTPG